MTATARTLDFSNVRDQGNFNRRKKPAGDYRAKVVEVVDYESKEGNPNFLFTIQVDGDRRASYPYYCGLEEKQLWKLRNLLVAVGLKSPGARTKIDPNKVVGRSFGLTLDDDEYEGRVNSTIVDIFPTSLDGAEFLNEAASSKKAAKKSRPVDDDEDDEDEDEEPPAKPAKKAAKKKPAPVEEDDEEEDDEEDEPEPPKKSAKKAAKKRPEPEDDDDEEDEEDDEDEEPPPPKKKSKKAKRRRNDDDDELDTDDL